MAHRIGGIDAARFARDGYVVLPRLLPPALTAPAVREINHRLGAGEHPGRDRYADTHDYLSEYVSSPAVMALAAGPVSELAESLLGAGKVMPLSQAQIALRFPAAHDGVVYEPLVHIDGPYSGMDAKKVLADRPLRYSLCAGIFLSDTPKPGMGNFTAYPGTHRLIAREVKRRGLGALRCGVEKCIALPAPVQVTGKTGDVVLFHFQLAHDKAPNFSPRIRRMAYFRFWHEDSWNDTSRAYLTRAMADPWLEWPLMRGKHGT